MKVKLVQTCGGCPEQYDGYIDGECVAYLRLRHGSFRAEYKDEVVYRAQPRGDGVFDSDEERRHCLNEACRAILEKHRNNHLGDYYEMALLEEVK